MATCPTCQSSVADGLAACPFDGTLLDKVPTLIGQVLGDRYKVLSQLGEGGMGTVYLAEHVLLGKKMAVKVLRPEFSRQEEVVRRFQQEAVAASQIGHEHIVNVTDFGRAPDGSFYFVMEQLEGESLSEVLRREGALRLPRALPILQQIAKALIAAHGRGIVHRDLKPDNVILLQREDHPDFVKVLDFGISKVNEATGSGGRLTRVGMIMGTPEYMAPEQAAGSNVDHRADIYAFGVVAYELVTGTLPFRAETPLATLMKHQSEAPEPPTRRRPDLALPLDVEHLILRAMSKRADARQQSMAEVSLELGRLTADLGLSTAFTPVPGPGGLRPVTLPPGATPSSTHTAPQWAPPPPLPAPRSGGTMQLDSGDILTRPERSPTPLVTDPNVTSPATPGAVAAVRAQEPTTPLSRKETLDEIERRALGKGSKKALVAAAVALLLLAGGGAFLALRGGQAPEPLPPEPAKPPVALEVPTPVPVPAAAPQPQPQAKPEVKQAAAQEPPRPPKPKVRRKKADTGADDGFGKVDDLKADPF